MCNRVKKKESKRPLMISITIDLKNNLGDTNSVYLELHFLQNFHENFNLPELLRSNHVVESFSYSQFRDAVD